MSDREKLRQHGEDEETGTEGTLSHAKEHLSPKRADQQEYPEDIRPPTPLEEAGERKGDEVGNTGTERRDE